MLYPIELLGHNGQHQNGRHRDGVHVNGTGRFCHVVFGLQGCGPFPFKQGFCASSCILHYPKKPSLQNACNAPRIVPLTH